MEVEFRRARPEDLEAAHAILMEAANWLLARGIAQYAQGFPVEYVGELIERGELYLARCGDEPVGTIVLQWRDTSCWPDAPDDAGYVHHLIVRRAFAHSGLGARFLLWAAEQARAAGKSYLRLDCWEGNPFLARYYERAGFSYRGKVYVEKWDYTGNLYEKAL